VIATLNAHTPTPVAATLLTCCAVPANQFHVWCAGIVATLAVVLMSLLGRDDSDYGGYDGAGEQVGTQVGPGAQIWKLQNVRHSDAGPSASGRCYVCP
jgi:hypothetical protein